MSNASEYTASVDVDVLRRGESIHVGRLTIEGVVNHDDELLLQISYKGQTTLYTMDELEAELVAHHIKRTGTVVRTLELPDGQDYVCFEDCNVIALSSSLDEAGRERALASATLGYDAR